MQKRIRLFHQLRTSCWLLVLSLVLPQRAYPQEAKLTFEHYTEEQGLSAPAVSSMLQDKKGFLWFGTWNGVDRFDGYTFTPYKYETGDSAVNVNAYTNTVFEDASGTIWAGTRTGLNSIEPRTGAITHYSPNPAAPGTEWSNNVTSIGEDTDGSMWIATDDGLNKFDRRSGTFAVFRHDSLDPGSISCNAVRKVNIDKHGDLWLGTGRGLDKFDRTTGKFIHLWTDPHESVEYWVASPYFINTIFEDSDELLWLGTNRGIVAFDKHTGVRAEYASDPGDPHSLSGNFISSICRDAAGTLWIGTFGTGLNSFDGRTGIFTRYHHDEADPGSISADDAVFVFTEQSGTTWVLTIGAGVNKLNRHKNYFRKYSIDEQRNGIISSSDVNGIYQSRSGSLWIGSSRGVDTLDRRNDKLVSVYKGKDYLLAVDKDESLWMGKAQGGIYRRSRNGALAQFLLQSGRPFDKGMRSACESRDGTIWLGTWEKEKGGLYMLEPASGIITQVGRFNSLVTIVHEDKFGLIWGCIQNGGLVRYDRKLNSFKRYMSVPHDSSTISYNSIMSVYEDHYGTVWFGFDRYDRAQDKFVRFDPRGELTGIGFKMFEDDHHNMWISTSQGISKVNPAAKTVKNYEGSYGFPSIRFSENIGCFTDKGEICFGGTNGFVMFNPDSIRDNAFIPPIAITAFRKYDKPFPVEQEVHLKYDDNFLAFEFVALSYVNTEKNRYAYKMEGLDKEWIYSGTRRYASYPNLDPGEYVFRVRGSNNDGVWNEAGTFMTIHIASPWWKTWWAYASYALLFLLALYGLRRYELNRAGLKNQVKLNEAVLKEKEETEKMKSRFFANISHEFRTPLTLILGPAEKIITKTSDDIIKDAVIIKRNSRRLLELINQLLDLSKLEAGKLILQASKGNIVSFVKGIALSFESLSEAKNITLKLLPEREFIELYFDREKMMQILTNIISNAFKFTPEEGKITISVSQAQRSDNTESVEIRIRDTGIGIPREELPKLFDRFYQVDSSFTKEYEGTGIGLALTKELVDLHHGRIHVESRKEDPHAGQPGWTEFTIVLPMGRDHLTGGEIVGGEEMNGDVEIRLDESRFLHAGKTTEESRTEAEETRTIILIVEDNYDMREYIKESLGEDYVIEEAVNGDQGVRKAQMIIPDLIISDMMMPKMDGNELVRIVKADETTCHIPVILLTARSDNEDKIEGLEIGADDYLTKPFNIRELKVRIKNLLTIRKRLQEKYSHAEARLPDGSHSNMTDRKKEAAPATPLSTLDEKFMAKVSEVIEKHLSEEEFTIEEFGAEVGMSRVQIYRKLKAITGKAASLYIRSVKLEKAKKMIAEKRGTISEIAYSLGFGSPAYFTRCFKEEYGFPPSELIR